MSTVRRRAAVKALREEGRQARIADRSRQACPHKLMNRFQWEQGWDAADRELARDESDIRIELSEVENMVTLEDAVDALDRLEGIYDLEASQNAGVLRSFLDGLKTKVLPFAVPTDEEGFILEGAGQHGFDTLDDEGSVYVVPASALIEYTKRQRTGPSGEWKLVPAEPTEEMIEGPRYFILYAETPGRTLEGARKHLEFAGVDIDCWPEWAKTQTGHLTKGAVAILVWHMMLAAVVRRHVQECVKECLERAGAPQ